MNGTKLDGMDKLQQALASLRIGENVKLTIFRKNQQLQIDVPIVERPFMPSGPANRKADSPAAGIPQTGKALPSVYRTAVRKRVFF